MNKITQRAALALTAFAASVPAFAVPVDLTTLTESVDFSTASTAILAVAGSLIVVYIAIKAAGFVLGMVRRG